MSVDDTLVYLPLIHSLLDECVRVVDVGCGRGAYADRVLSGSNMFDLRGPGRTILGLDIDDVVSSNPFLDDFGIIRPDTSWPVADDYADLVVSDWTLEHVVDPRHFVAEVARILRPGGAFIARSINRYSFLACLSRMVPNGLHARVLARAQPDRPSVDVFPAFYRLNTPRDLRSLLTGDFDFTIAYRPGLENYVGAVAPRLARVLATVERLLPGPTQTAFIVCARRR